MEKPDVVSGDGNPVLGLRQRQGDPWGSLVTQAESMGQAQYQLVQKIRQRVTDDNTDLWPPRVCTHLHTHHTQLSSYRAHCLLNWPLTSLWESPVYGTAHILHLSSSVGFVSSKFTTVQQSPRSILEHFCLSLHPLMTDRCLYVSGQSVSASVLLIAF